MMELLDYLRVPVKHRRLIGVLCASAGVGALALSLLIAPMYTAMALILVRPADEIRLSATGDEIKMAIWRGSPLHGVWTPAGGWQLFTTGRSGSSPLTSATWWYATS